MNIELQPEDATDPKVTWSSSNSQVVSVSDNGYITAKNPGTATITAKTENGKYDTIYVTVGRKTQEFRITVTASCTGNNSVGNDWSKYFQVNNSQVDSGSYILLTMGDSINIYTEIVEEDSIPDIGTATQNVIVSKGYLDYGFSVTQIITVCENRGRYSGNTATWRVEYKFKPV